MTLVRSVRWTLVAAALASVGCLDVKPCGKGLEDCPAGTACTTEGVCRLLPTDGGTSGGQAGSAGGGQGEVHQAEGRQVESLAVRRAVPAVVTQVARAAVTQVVREAEPVAA